MSDIAIRAEGLGKRYQIGASTRRHNTLRDAIADRVKRFTRVGAPRETIDDRELWALRHATFDVRQGEIIGVVGRNGAGKSTLLKILSRITEPTEGRARIRGRVASLLEVGVGFHPELSARENIFVNGAILGMKRAEIARRFDEILAFAEVERFVDTAVKHLSSGMYLRLAFAVAAHLEPEILLVDEVLAVGDAGFQKKCLGKMKEVGQSGRTIFFVSHNLAAISSLCRRALLIEQSRIVDDGPAPEIVQRYLSSFGGDNVAVDHRTDRHGDGRIRVTHIRLVNADEQPVTAFQSGQPAQIVLRYERQRPEPLRNVLVNLYLTSSLGERVCDFQTDLSGDNFAEIPPAGELICTIPKLPLQPGTYSLTFRIYSSERLAMDIVENAARIEVQPGDFFGRGRLPEPGAIFVDHAWRCRASESVGTVR